MPQWCLLFLSSSLLYSLFFIYRSGNAIIRKVAKKSIKLFIRCIRHHFSISAVKLKFPNNAEHFLSQCSGLLRKHHAASPQSHDISGHIHVMFVFAKLNLMTRADPLYMQTTQAVQGPPVSVHKGPRLHPPTKPASVFAAERWSMKRRYPSGLEKRKKNK